MTSTNTPVTNDCNGKKIEKTFFLYNAVLGSGGFGTVCSALLVNNRKWVAVKEIRKADLVKHKSGISMLFNELEALKRVNHTYVINLHLAFTDNFACYMVLDLKLGGDLRHFLKHNVCFEEYDVAFIIACLASALSHIHSKGIIHRDIKPENILLDQDGYPYLVDFGVSYVHSECYTSTRAGAGSNCSSEDSCCKACLRGPIICHLGSGTKQFLAPEVFTTSHAHGPESDFWSLGVVAHELVYGHRPFKLHPPLETVRCLESAYWRQQHKMKLFFATATTTSTTTTAGTATALSNASDIACSVEHAHCVEQKSPSIRPLVNDACNVFDFGNNNIYCKHSILDYCNFDSTTQWDFDGSEVFPYSMLVPLPNVSKRTGKISTPLIALMAGLFDIRPQFRLGKMSNSTCTVNFPNSIFSTSLLVQNGLSDEAKLLSRSISPSFIPGRKFLSPTGEFDPIAAAVGREITHTDLLVSVDSQHKLDSFFFLSEEYRKSNM